MIYRYNKRELKFEKNFPLIKWSLFSMIILLLASFVSGRYVRYSNLEEIEKELLVLNLKEEESKFTEEKFVNELIRLNVKYPHIVMAQSIVETGHFSSHIFIENHNLFGMKEAMVRVNTARGTQFGHAYYDDWYESVYDYAFYQCRYLSNLKSESEYFSYLSRVYAEAGDGYITQLKKVIEQEKLKELFNR